MVSIGLVPQFTVEAAKKAALGAGANVLEVYSYDLTSDELKRIEVQNPDIILLVGGCGRFGGADRRRHVKEERDQEETETTEKGFHGMSGKS